MTAYETATAAPATAPLATLTSGLRRHARWLRPVGALTLLAILVWRVGTGPFVAGIGMVDAPSVAAAVGIGIVTTVCCAWRWSVIADGLGASVPMRAAIPAYYRSQFLNLTLPGGVVGDVHRAVRHGRADGDVGRSARVVAWERAAGQAVQIALTVVVLAVLPSPLRAAMPAIGLAVAVAAVGIAILLRIAPDSSRIGRMRAAVASDARRGLLGRRALTAIVLASAIVVAGHAATFLIAAHAAGITAESGRLLPTALVVLLAMSIPLSIGGWGPREAVAAWAFALAGLSAAQGVSAAVVYGVLVLFACLPGALVLLVAWRRRG